MLWNFKYSRVIDSFNNLKMSPLSGVGKQPDFQDFLRRIK
jgi:hypothetical protein